MTSLSATVNTPVPNAELLTEVMRESFRQLQDMLVEHPEEYHRQSYFMNRIHALSHAVSSHLSPSFTNLPYAPPHPADVLIDFIEYCLVPQDNALRIAEMYQEAMTGIDDSILPTMRDRMGNSSGITAVKHGKIASPVIPAVIKRVDVERIHATVQGMLELQSFLDGMELTEWRPTVKKESDYIVDWFIVSLLDREVITAAEMMVLYSLEANYPALKDLTVRTIQDHYTGAISERNADIATRLSLYTWLNRDGQQVDYPELWEHLDSKDSAAGTDVPLSVLSTMFLRSDLPPVWQGVTVELVWERYNAVNLFTSTR